MPYLRQAAPIWFRAVAILLLAWGVMGCYAWLQQYRLGADAMGPASAYDRALFARLPGWYIWLFAVSVGTGFFGAFALLTRSVTARPLFVASLVAVVVQFGWMFVATDIVKVKGVQSAMGFPLLIAAIAVFQIWIAGYAFKRGWIR